MDRHDIPETLIALINKATEINLIDFKDILVLGSTHGDNFKEIVDEIVHYAYCNIHVNDDHEIIVPFADAFYGELLSKKEETRTPAVVEEVVVKTFEECFESFFEGCVKKNADYMKQWFPNNHKDQFSWKRGKRYIKVIRSGSVHCFVDTQNGDVLKAAGWNAPAKHARGNIFNDDNGLNCMHEFGAAYLR